ncbi:MAG: hypothetical protein AAF400_03065 [Bacteroidota bacterium]
MWVPRREAIEQLKELLTLRERILNNLSRLSKPIQELQKLAKLIADSPQAAIEGTLKALASIEAKLAELFSEDAELRRLHEPITSVGGVEKLTAGQVIVDTPAFKNIKKGKRVPVIVG